MSDQDGRSDGSPKLGTSRYELERVIPPFTLPGADPIIGGRRTNNFPDCCAVGNTARYCGSGSLIAADLAITARHCGSIERVFLKGNDIDDPDAGETIRVVRRIVHPDELVDLQLLVLEHKSTVPPRRILPAGRIQATDGVVAGFGTIDAGGTIGYGIKREVEVPIHSLDCSEPHASANYGCSVAIEMVAGHRGLNRDTCQGDSGGPLYIRGAQGYYYLTGMTLRGIGVGACGDGGIYLRVDRFVAWIQAEAQVSL